MTPAEIYGQEMAEETKRVSDEWDALNVPIWDEMTEEQRLATLKLAREQAARNKAIRKKFLEATNGG